MGRGEGRGRGHVTVPHRLRGQAQAVEEGGQAPMRGHSAHAPSQTAGTCRAPAAQAVCAAATQAVAGAQIQAALAVVPCWVLGVLLLLLRAREDELAAQEHADVVLWGRCEDDAAQSVGTVCYVSVLLNPDVDQSGTMLPQLKSFKPQSDASSLCVVISWSVQGSIPSYISFFQFFLECSHWGRPGGLLRPWKSAGGPERRSPWGHKRSAFLFPVTGQVRQEIVKSSNSSLTMRGV